VIENDYKDNVVMLKMFQQCRTYLTYSTVQSKKCPVRRKVATALTL